MTPFDIDPSIVPVPYSLSLIPSAPLRPLTLAHCELDRRAQQQQGQGGDRNNRTFYIRGHPDAVEQCKRIICEKVGMLDRRAQQQQGQGGDRNNRTFYIRGHPDAVEQCKRIICEKVGMPSPQQQPQQQVAINPSTGQPDYSQQWIDYYRSLGLNREAEAIEQQAKQQQQGLQCAVGRVLPLHREDQGGGGHRTADQDEVWRWRAPIIDAVAAAHPPRGSRARARPRGVRGRLRRAHVRRVRRVRALPRLPRAARTAGPPAVSWRAARV
ncbi:hypothetical protein NE865_09007 [Phthorimaea operculella]|nr:hypothetical protein NE865_09007 [Phthorimaea operculella]